MLPLQLHQKLLRETTPSLRYDGKEPFFAWQKRASARLAALLGMPQRRCPDAFCIEKTEKTDDYTKLRFRFESEPGYFVPCCLLLPPDAEYGKPLPTVLCLQGHSTGMHISLGTPLYEGDEDTIAGGDRDFALQAVREGYCAVTLEQRGFGDCGGTPQGPDCFLPAMTGLLLGRTLLGERVWDILRLLDVLAAHFPQVDPARILCMGNSGGGTTTLYAACMDTRIGFAMPSCALCTFADSIAAMHHCACNYIPGLAAELDMGDLAGLIAPRPLVIVAGKEDPIFPLPGVREAYAQAEKLYAAAGAPQKLRLVLGEGGHRFYAAQAWPCIRTYLKP